MWQVQDKGSQVGPPEGFQRSPGPAIQAVEPEPDQQAGWVDGVRDGLELGEGLDSLVKDHSLDVGAGFLVGHGMADQPPGFPPVFQNLVLASWRELRSWVRSSESPLN